MSTGCQHRLYIPWTPSQQCPVITRISCPLSSQLWPAGKTSRQKSSGSLESRRRKCYLLSQCMHVNLFAPEHFAEKRVLKLVKPCFLFFGGPITICCSFLHVPKVGFVLPNSLCETSTWHLDSCPLGDTWYCVILWVFELNVRVQEIIIGPLWLL